jgi:Domain of unknown function (DUF4338)
MVFPWVHVKSVASKILAHGARQMPHDWQTHYGVCPLLLETLVDAAAFSRDLLSNRQLDLSRADLWP